MEKTVVRQILYPTFLSPLPIYLSHINLPSGLLAFYVLHAIICLLNILTSMLLSNPSVTVTSLDFSKAFDTVRHSTVTIS